jgi:hypothetical protein
VPPACYPDANHHLRDVFQVHAGEVGQQDLPGVPIRVNHDIRFPGCITALTAPAVHELHVRRRGIVAGLGHTDVGNPPITGDLAGCRDAVERELAQLTGRVRADGQTDQTGSVMTMV